MRDPLTVLNQVVGNLSDKIKIIEARYQRSKVLVKNTTGLPTVGGTSGQILINTVDNKVYMWADNDWRQIGNSW
jgi:hypothetical protein